MVNLLNKIKLPLLFAISLVLASCQSTSGSNFDFKKSEFQQNINGKQTDLFFLKNAQKMEVAICNYGARVVGVLAVDKKGSFTDVTTGFNSLDQYINCPEPFHGPIVGPVGNRIAKGQFILDEVKYQLPINNGVNHLHGGPVGFHHQVWEVKSISSQFIELQILKADGQLGYPGNLTVNVRYELNDNNEFSVAYEAKSDKKTLVNLTWHPFFNLAGEGHTINDHLLMINADKYTPVDVNLIPFGTNLSVKNTPFDFREERTIGRDLHLQKSNKQLTHGAGYDHNWVLKRPKDKSMVLAARLSHPASGRVMEVFTQEPGLQFYGGNFFNGKTYGKNGKAHIYRGALALETQHYPDAPNQKNFTSIELDKGEVYQTKSIYKFSVQK